MRNFLRNFLRNSLFAICILASVPAEAWFPIGYTVPQYEDANGNPYSGAVLKAYRAGTSTPISMATDYTGGTLVSTATLNATGYPTTSGNVFIPHFDENYKLALYPSSAAAASNTGAIWTIDNLQVSSASASGQLTDVASATTISLNDDTTDYFNITGTTTITGITLAEGVEVTTRFASSLTLTTGTFVKNIGAVNIVTSAGDIAVWRGESGGVVRMVDYISQTYRAASEATIASATTTDLGAGGSHYVSVTGTTTITSFGSSASTIAPLYFGRFTGILTLTHNATSLILPGGANITTAAGDTFVAKYEGSGNWRVVSYTKASGASIKNQSGTWVLISTQNASDAASINFTGSLTSTYKIYRVYCYDVYPASAAVLWGRYGQAASYLTTATYNSSLVGRDTAGNPETADSGGGTKIIMSGASMQATSTQGGTWDITIFHPSHSAETRIMWTGSYKSDSLARYNSHVGSGMNTAITAITDFQLLASTGNINGTCSMYAQVP